jgi:hypothetical protein
MYDESYFLASANQNEVYNRTGCLSACERTNLDLQPYTEMRTAVI